MDLISCRNVLIYLNASLQKRTIHLFHYALNPGGFLFLGPAEGVGELGGRLQAVNRKMRLFRQSGEGAATAFQAPPMALALEERRTKALRNLQGAWPGEGSKGSLRSLMEQAVLDHYLHAALLVDERGQILHIMGRIGRFLEPAQGEASVSVLDMARSGLRQNLANALYRARQRKEPVACRGIRVNTDGGFLRANLVVRPMGQGVPAAGGSLLFLVLLEEEGQPAGGEEILPGHDSGACGAEARVAALEQELQAKEEYIQTAMEEMATSHEELKSANEELQAINAEMGSSHEELETSKEEL
jgi:two-component system CheB/CheR fusion protein